MDEELPSWRKDGIEVDFDLTPGEVIWRGRQKMLERHGYLLRPRYRPEWVPSYLNDMENAILHEDAIMNPLPKLIDAKRLSDGKLVKLKTVKRGSTETAIAAFLSADERASDPMNHCVPLLDIIKDENFPTLEFIVMPLLRPFDRPPFFTVAEVLDFIQQTLEGLCFMHKVGVAHRDCSGRNIMFDAAGMFPKGFHPALWVADADGDIARPLRRSDVPAVKYFFTDFGLSTRFQEHEPRLVTGFNGLDREVPELSSVEPYDPFATDVFILGNVFIKNFVMKFSNMRFLVPLVTSMTEPNPTERPTSIEALEIFHELAKGLPGYARRWRLREPAKGRCDMIIRDIDSTRREALYLVRSCFKLSRRAK